MPAVKIEGRDFLLRGRILKTLNLKDDLLNDIGNLEKIIASIREEKIAGDILTFSQQITDPSPRFNYPMEWDNAAAVAITTYEQWFTKQIHPNTRNKIRRAQKAGVTVAVESLSLKLAEGITEIFNETPMRRGKKYSYYGRDVETVEKEWSIDEGHNDFLVAYHEEEVIGFIQLVYGKHAARTSGTVAKLAHRKRAPMNALFSKAVETCAHKQIPYLIYGKYVYGKNEEDSLTSFKKNNGFVRIDLPRYFIPLSIVGRLAIRCGLHKGISNILPQSLLGYLKRTRSLRHPKTSS